MLGYTRYISHDFTSDYKVRLTKLHLLPLMYIFELSDMLFFVNSLKNPTSSFNINFYVSISQSITRSRSAKLNHNISFTNKECHFYFNRICLLWNSLPIIDTSLLVETIKRRIKHYLWNHFTVDFSSANPHKLHNLFPCGSCINDHPAMNFDHL